MVILDVAHPDIEEFIWCKALEERKARVLEQAGFDMDLDGRDSHSLQYQNANNSVRVTDEFMQAVVDGADWSLREVTTGKVVRTVRARELFRQLGQAAWECADPGMQFDTTINHWHTAANTGRINGSNPCSEYMHLDDSACNLASLNLLKFLDDDETFDVEGFRHGRGRLHRAGDPRRPGRLPDRGHRRHVPPLPTAGHRLRQHRRAADGAGPALRQRRWPGLRRGHHVAHDRARLRSVGRTASRMGPFAGFAENREHMLRVLRQHQEAAAQIDEVLVPPELLSAAQESWDMACELGERYGVRNSQASVLAPTGTIGLMMDCDTGHRARPRSGEDEEAGGRRHDVDRQPDGAAGARAARLRPRRDRRHRRLHRRAQVDRRRPAPARPRAPAGVRVLDGRQRRSTTRGT